MTYRKTDEEITQGVSGVENKLGMINFIRFMEITDNKYADYFSCRNDNIKNLSYCYIWMSNKMPPAIRLRYNQGAGLREDIKNEIAEKYREIFGEYADYQEIP